MGAASLRAVEPYAIGRYRARMRALVAQTCDMPAFDAGRTRGRMTRAEETSLRDWRPARTYLVCSTPGAGGAFLSEALTATGVAGFPRQLVLHDSTGGVQGDDGPHGFERDLQSDLENAATPNGVSGAVVSLPDLERLIARLRSSRGSAAADAAALLAHRLPGLRLIRLTRRDRVRQALARLRAAGRQLPPPVQGPSARRFEPTERLIRREMERVAADEAAWDAWLAHWKDPLIEVVYEDLVARYTSTMGSVIRQFGLDDPGWLDVAARPEIPLDEVVEKWARRMVRAAGPPVKTKRPRRRRST
jgi:LPS sulfotransferase NodH